MNALIYSYQLNILCAGKAAELELTLKEKEKSYSILQECFKKEMVLRKKYKNELEDLKRTLRVYDEIEN